jgi:hypothetical protein
MAFNHTQFPPVYLILIGMTSQGKEEGKKEGREFRPKFFWDKEAQGEGRIINPSSIHSIPIPTTQLDSLRLPLFAIRKCIQLL